MKHVGSSEARRHLPQLLDRVERGEGFLITRRGRPAAQVLPAPAEHADARAVIDAFKAYSASRGRTLGRLSYRTLTDDGRRF